MLDQKFNEGVPAGLPRGARVSHKTGSITRTNYDAAIVYSPGRKPYVLVVLTRGIEDEKLAHKLIADTSGVVYGSSDRKKSFAWRDDRELTGLWRSRRINRVNQGEAVQMAKNPDSNPDVLDQTKHDPLTEELGKYENRWVAILESERKVVGSGDTAVQAKQEAKARGYSEIALFKVPAAGKLYAYQT